MPDKTTLTRQCSTFQADYTVEVSSGYPSKDGKKCGTKIRVENQDGLEFKRKLFHPAGIDIEIAGDLGFLALVNILDTAKRMLCEIAAKNGDVDAEKTALENSGTNLD